MYLVEGLKEIYKDDDSLRLHRSKMFNDKLKKMRCDFFVKTIIIMLLALPFHAHAEGLERLRKCDFTVCSDYMFRNIGINFTMPSMFSDMEKKFGVLYHRGVAKEIHYRNSVENGPWQVWMSRPVLESKDSTCTLLCRDPYEYFLEVFTRHIRFDSIRRFKSFNYFLKCLNESVCSNVSFETFKKNNVTCLKGGESPCNADSVFVIRLKNNVGEYCLSAVYANKDSSMKKYDLDKELPILAIDFTPLNGKSDSRLKNLRGEYVTFVCMFKDDLPYMTFTLFLNEAGKEKESEFLADLFKSFQMPDKQRVPPTRKKRNAQ